LKKTCRVYFRDEKIVLQVKHDFGEILTGFKNLGTSSGQGKINIEISENEKTRR